MIPALTTNDMFEAQSVVLALDWVTGRLGKTRLLEPTNAKHPGMALVGHLNFVHPNRIQVLGVAEVAYLNRLADREHTKLLRELCACERTAAVIMANCENPGARLTAEAERAAMPLLVTPLASPVIIDHLQYFLARALAPRVTVHGVYMEVMGMGILITGESGIGKSELALELLSRNHRLISDDAVEFIRVAPDVLVGQCPTALSDYLEVRGLGILDVRLMFGETAVRHKKRLHMIVRMVQMQKNRLSQIDRLAARQLTRPVLDVDIPEVVLYVGAGRNLAVLVETATRALILRTWGINPLDELMKRQQALIDNQSTAANNSAPSGAESDPLPPKPTANRVRRTRGRVPRRAARKPRTKIQR